MFFKKVHWKLFLHQILLKAIELSQLENVHLVFFFIYLAVNNRRNIFPYQKAWLLCQENIQCII